MKLGVYASLIVCSFSLVACSGVDQASADSLLPDLEIVHAEVISGRQPSLDFQYYEYIVKLVIKNTGTAFKAKNVYINAGDDQENKRLKGRDSDFGLEKNETVEVSYQILNLDSSKKQFIFQVDAGDDAYTKQNGGLIEERDEENNYYAIQIF